MKPWILLFMALLCMTAGCQRQQEGGPLAVSGRMFVFNYRVAMATYLVTLSRNGAIPDRSVIEATFEDPAGGAALTLRQAVFPGESKLVLQSPPVHCVVKDRPYAVSIRLVSAEGTVLQSLETSITSSDDQSILPEKPLVVGPLYTPNPEVFRPDGTADFAPDRRCPARPAT